MQTRMVLFTDSYFYRGRHLLPPTHPTHPTHPFAPSPQILRAGLLALAPRATRVATRVTGVGWGW